MGLTQAFCLGQWVWAQGTQAQHHTVWVQIPTQALNLQDMVVKHET